MSKELVLAGEEGADVGFDLLWLFSHKSNEKMLTESDPIGRAKAASQIADWISGRGGATLNQKATGKATIQKMERRATAGDQEAALAVDLINHFIMNPIRPPALIYQMAFDQVMEKRARQQSAQEAAYNYGRFIKAYNQASAENDASLVNLYGQRIADLQSKYGDGLGEAALKRGYASRSDYEKFLAAKGAKSGVSGFEPNDQSADMLAKLWSMEAKFLLKSKAEGRTGKSFRTLMSQTSDNWRSQGFPAKYGSLVEHAQRKGYITVDEQKKVAEAIAQLA